MTIGAHRDTPFGFHQDFAFKIDGRHTSLPKETYTAFPKPKVIVLPKEGDGCLVIDMAGHEVPGNFTIIPTPGCPYFFCKQLEQGFIIDGRDWISPLWPVVTQTCTLATRYGERSHSSRTQSSFSIYFRLLPLLVSKNITGEGLVGSGI